MQSKLKTPCAELWLDDNGILHADFIDIVAELDEVKEHVDMVVSHYGEHFPLLQLVDLRNLKQSKKESRDYLARPQMAEIVKASAVLVRPMSRIVGNLFIKFSKPPFPMKLFSNKAEAMQWLLEFK